MLATLTRRPAAPFHDSHLTGLWWKFLITGPALLGAVIVAAGLDVEAWFVGFVVVLAAIVRLAIGHVLGVARLVTRLPPSPA